MENKNLNNENVKNENTNEERELKPFKDCSNEELKSDCIIVPAKLLKLVTKAKNNKPSRTYYQISINFVPGICDKDITLTQEEFIHVVRSYKFKLEQVEALRPLAINVLVRPSCGKSLNSKGELRDYHLLEIFIDRMVRKSVFLSDIDVDNVDDSIKFIKRKGNINFDENAEQMPTFLDL